MRLAAVGADDVLALGANGLWRVTGQRPASPLTSFTDTANWCPYPEFVLSTSGAFLLKPTCDRKSLRLGHFDGATASVDQPTFEQSFPTASGMGEIECMTVAPNGGFYVVTRLDKVDHLYYVNDTLPTPSIKDARCGTIFFRRRSINPSTLRCSLVATWTMGSRGTLYLRSSKVLWSLDVHP